MSSSGGGCFGTRRQRLLLRSCRWDCRSSLLCPRSGSSTPSCCALCPSASQSGCTRFRSEEHTSELQSPYAISYAAFCLKKNFKDAPTIGTLTDPCERERGVLTRGR